jgi:hypothetical protein
MGEIKSTLDLVMEKTRHLTLSQEEKDAQTKVEVHKRLKGLVQKYQDNLLRKEQLEKELDILKKTYAMDVDQILLNLLLSGLEPGRHYKMYLELLNEICGLNVSGLEKIFQDFKGAVKSAAERRVHEIKADLEKKRFIRGAAVVPNLEGDREWLSMLVDIKGRYDQILSREKGRLATGLSSEI